MQAFWVRVKPAVLQTDTTGILSVYNTMRSHSSVDNKMKSPAQKNSEQKLLRLKISNDANSDETLLAKTTNEIVVETQTINTEETNSDNRLLSSFKTETSFGSEMITKLGVKPAELRPKRGDSNFAQF
jgi:hypothetical protein